MSLGEVAGDRGGQRAAGAVCVGVVDARRGKPVTGLTVKQQVICTVGKVPALDEHSAAGFRSDFLCCLLHAVSVGDLVAADGGGLVQIRRDERAQGEQLAYERIGCVPSQQNLTAR